MWEDRVVGRSIRMRAARHVVEKMLEAAMNSPEDPDDPLSSRLAFAVVDTSGSLVYFARMNAGGPLNSQVAIIKPIVVYTAGRIHSIKWNSSTNWGMT